MRAIINILLGLLLSMGITPMLYAQETKDLQTTQEDIPFLKRIMVAQESNNDTAFYAAENAYMTHLEGKKDWKRYYNIWINRIVYDINNNYYHSALDQITFMAQDINQRKLPEYKYNVNLGLGMFYAVRDQYLVAKKYYLQAIEEIDTVKNALTAYNLYLALAISSKDIEPEVGLSYVRRIPTITNNPTDASNTLGVKCILAFAAGKNKEFERYFESYDSLMLNYPNQVSRINYYNVLACHHQIKGDSHMALAYCDSIPEALDAAELKADIYARMGDWKNVVIQHALRDSIRHKEKGEAEITDLYALEEQLEIMKYEVQHRQSRIKWLVALGAMAALIIFLLLFFIFYRLRSHRRLKQNYDELCEARRQAASAIKIRLAFINSMAEQLRSPLRVLQGYARIYNNPTFHLTDEQKHDALSNILSSARTVEMLLNPVLNMFSGNDGESMEANFERRCQNSLRNPLTALIGMSSMITDEKEGTFSDEDISAMTKDISDNAYKVYISTSELLAYCMVDIFHKAEKTEEINLNNLLQSVLHDHDFRNTKVERQFTTTLPDDTMVTSLQESLSQMINCLLSNADEHAEGVVSIHTFRHASGRIAIAVANEGPTIPEEDSERIFAPFVQLSTQSEGLGLGLPLVRRLADSLDYEVYLDKEYQKGVRFIILLS